MFLTVFTPTYNRADTLGRCYDSLCNQTCLEFCWLVVDDGSTDKTAELVQGWMAENKISISYIKKENGGKPSAFNMGIARCETPLFFCVDSDDYVIPEAVEILRNGYETIKNRKDIYGIVVGKQEESGRNLHNTLPEHVAFTTVSALYDVYGIKGDLAVIMKTSWAKQYPYPIIDGETFIGDSYLFNQLDQTGKVFILPKIIYICDYRESGYSYNMTRVIKENPEGYLLLKTQKFAQVKGFIQSCKQGVCFVTAALLAKKNALEVSPRKSLTLLLYPVGYLAYYIRYARGLRIKSPKGKIGKG